MRDKIAKFLTESFLFEFDAEVTPATNLFQAGLLDSYGFIELIEHLESELDLRFEVEELDGREFASLDRIVARVERKLRER